MKSFRKPLFAFRLTTLLVLAASMASAMHGQRVAGRRASSSTERAEVKNVFWQPDEVKLRSPVLMSEELSGPAREVNGTWLGKRIRFRRSDTPRLWVALGGGDIDQKPGKFELRVRATIRGLIVHLTKQIEVKEAQFGTSEVNVAQDFV